MCGELVNGMRAVDRRGAMNVARMQGGGGRQGEGRILMAAEMVVVMGGLVVGCGGRDVKDVVGVMGSVIVVCAGRLGGAFVRVVVGVSLGGGGADEGGQLVGEVHGVAGLVVVVGRELAEGIWDGEERGDEEVVEVSGAVRV